MTHSLKKQIEQLIIEARVDVRAARAEIGQTKRSRPKPRTMRVDPAELLCEPSRKSYG
jgi:hypothetical protein